MKRRKKIKESRNRHILKLEFQLQLPFFFLTSKAYTCFEVGNCFLSFLSFEGLFIQERKVVKSCMLEPRPLFPRTNNQAAVMLIHLQIPPQAHYHESLPTEATVRQDNPLVTGKATKA